MRIELNPVGVYFARILGLVAAQIAFSGGATSPTLVGLGCALGAIFYWGDFKVRRVTGEGANLDPFARLASNEFWVQLGWTTGLYVVIVLGLGRLIGMKSSPGPIEWIAFLTLMGMASKNVRGLFLREFRRI